MSRVDLFGNEEKITLYIVGNGFDLHHDIPSRYSDFQNYLNANHHAYLAGQIEIFYPSNVNSPEYKWGDLENALGEIDFKATYAECNSDVEIDYDHMMRSAAILEDNPQQILAEALDELHALFEEWVHSIDISSEKDNALYNFNTEGLFLNFNYTETLEELYSVPRSAITYIHGRRGRDEELILGHCVEIDPANAYLEENAIYEDDGYKGIIEVANAQRKNVDEIIASHKKFWEAITTVNRVIVYGHSLSEVDIPYFHMIFHSIAENAEWHFGCHTKKDKEKASSLISQLGINEERCYCFNF